MEKIRATMIIEMLGRPAEHIKKVMNDLIKRLEAEKGIILSEKKIHNPKPVEKQAQEELQIPGKKELFSLFSEIEILADSVLDIIRIVFVYMPAHIEVISPDEFKMQNFDLTTVLNEITRKLHQYDAIAKNALMQNQMLAKRIMEIQGKIQDIQKENQPNITLGENKTPKAKKSTKKKKR